MAKLWGFPKTFGGGARSRYNLSLRGDSSSTRIFLDRSVFGELPNLRYRLKILKFWEITKFLANGILGGKWVSSNNHTPNYVLYCFGRTID